MIRDSLEALAYAIGQECDKSQYQAEHTSIRISVSTWCLSNGLPHCSVNVECGAGCGWLMQAYGSEAVELERRATVAQTIFSDPKRTVSNSEVATMMHKNATFNFLCENPVSKISVTGAHATDDDFQS